MFKTVNVLRRSLLTIASAKVQEGEDPSPLNQQVAEDFLLSSPPWPAERTSLPPLTESQIAFSKCLLGLSRAAQGTSVQNDSRGASADTVLRNAGDYEIPHSVAERGHERPS